MSHTLTVTTGPNPARVEERIQRALDAVGGAA